MANPESAQGAERFPNVEPIETAYARFRIIYDNHKLAHNPEIVGDSDAFVSEALREFDYSVPEDAKAAIDARWESYSKRVGSNSAPRPSIAGPAFQERLKAHPYFLCDIVDTKRELDALDEIIPRTKFAEMLAGAAGATYLAKNLAMDGLTRRKLLRNGIALALAAKGAGHVAELGVDYDDHRQLSPSRKVLRRANEAMSPETESIIVTYRNAIWAHKLERIASEMQASTPGRKPTIDLLAGKLHSGMEDMLRMDPKKRLEYIRRATKVISAFYEIGNNGILISPIARFEYSKERNTWEAVATYRDPELRAIEEEVRRK